MTRPALLALTALLLGACRDDSPSESLTEEDLCGDPDGNGGDTGDIPNLLGNWTSDFGANLFSSDCGLPDFNSGSDAWLDGSMEIRGSVPDQIYALFDDNTEERYFGLVSGNGGVNFSGIHEENGIGTMYAAFGGLAYYDVYRERDYIDGFVFIGIDTNDDGNIDCSARGEWTARKSGA